MTGPLDRRHGFLAAVVLAGVAMAALALLVASSVDKPSQSAPVSGPPRGEDQPAAATPIASLSSGWVGQELLFAEAGFQIRIPRFWAVDEHGANVEMGGEGTDFSVRVGDSRGQLLTCDQPDRPWERCRDVVITSLTGFADAVKQGPVEGCSGLCAPWPNGRTAMLAGEDAWRVDFAGYEYPARSGENALYILALHEGRPYFLRFHTSADRTPGSLWDEIAATFEFVDPPTTGGPMPTGVPTETAAQSATPLVLESPPAGMVLYANLEDDYALWIPQDLAASVAPVIVHGIPRPGIAKFGKAEIGAGSEFTISIGTRDGRIRPCPHGYCDEVTVTSLDDLGRALYTNPYYVAIVRESRSETVLGGEPARTKEVRLRGLSWGPPLFTFVYSFHDGRPVVLTFDAWSLPGRGMLTAPPQLQMLSSFTFLDE